MNKSFTNALPLLAKPLAEDVYPKNGWQIKICNCKFKKEALNDQLILETNSACICIQMHISKCPRTKELR